MTTTPRSESPFTLSEYRSLIQLAKSRFAFRGFDEFDGDGQILWRHDLEHLPHEMDKMVRVNADEGIVSTVFVQLRCPFYNALSGHARALFAEWLRLGTRIGLHFDWEFFRDDLGNLERHLATEKERLEQVIATPITVFSYHNPAEVILARHQDMAGMINAYHPRFFLAGAHYISDSNGRWRSRNLREVLGDPAITRLQVNLHDTWWGTDERIPQIAKLDRAFVEDAAWRSQHYRNTAAIVVDWIV